MFAKVNGKDVLWSLYTLRFTNSENLFQDCKATDEDLSRADKVNELYRDLRVRMKNNFFFQNYREKQRYESGSRFAKVPCALLQ